MVRTRKLKGGNKTSEMGRGHDAKSRRRIKKKTSLVIKCESNLCQVLLESMGEMQFRELAKLPLRIRDQLRKGSIKVDKSSRSRKMIIDRRARVKRSGMCVEKEVERKTQRSRRPTKARIPPKCKPLLPQRLLLHMTQTMGNTMGNIDGANGATVAGTTGGSNGGITVGPAQPQTVYAPIGAAIEAFCTPCPPAAPAALAAAAAPTCDSNLMVVVSSHHGMMNHTLYSWNNAPRNVWAGFPTQQEPANIFNHIQNNLADISFMPLQEDQAIEQFQEPMEEEIQIEPKTSVSTVDIYEHIRNMLSGSPICNGGTNCF